MNNLDRIKSAISDYFVDAVFLTGAINRRYAFGFSIAEGAAVITPEKSYYFTDSRYIEDARSGITGAEVVLTDHENPVTERICDVLKEHEIKRLGFEEAGMTVAEYNRYSEKFQVDMVPCQRLFSEFRAVKGQEELSCMEKAQEITDLTFSEMLTVIQTGMTEQELAAELIYRLYKNGAQDLSFAPIVVSGPNSSKPHGVPGGRKIQPGDFITMDFGCVWNGYCSDMTRTVAVGYATEEMWLVYDTVLKAQLVGIKAARSAISGRELDKAARDLIEKAGYGACFGHGFGHSLGLEVHEMPNAAPSATQILNENMVLSAEPGIYLPGKFGVRIEDVIVIRQNGCKNITKSPKELIIL